MKQDSEKKKKEWIKDISYVRTAKIEFYYVGADGWVVDVKYHVWDLDGRVLMTFLN